jgi:hypothetical protein
MDNYVDNPAIYAQYPLDTIAPFSIFVIYSFGTTIMARPLTVTKERILSAALSLVRSGGPSSLTARSLCEALSCGANAIFSSFGSIQGVRDAVHKEARALYRRRVGAGFSLNPPFKGFGMALLWFAMDEPQLYSLVMEADTPAESLENYVDTYVGFKQESLAAIASSFGLQGHDAEMLYYQMVLVALGLAQACTRGGSPLSIPQVSEILGKSVRALLMVIRAGVDERERFVPQAGTGPGGDVDFYVLMQTLVGQDHLLEQLHAAPRYIQDGEWTELERVLRNSFNIPTELLRQTKPGLTRGDLRVYILSHLQFSVSEQAVLLGISPASVTKARQRLKVKLKL